MRLGRRTLFLLLCAAPAWAQTYELSWWSVDNGGVMGAPGGPYALDATAGQPEAGGPFAGSPYALHSGFWSLIAVGGGGGSDADLSLAKTDSVDPVAPGTDLTYTLQVTNLGPASSPGMTVTDTLPGDVSFVTSIPSSPICTHASGTVTCVLGGLAPSASATVMVRVSVSPSASGTITNTATVAGTAPDPVPGNNADSEPTQVLGPAATAEGELVHGTLLHGDLAAAGGSADVDLYRIHQRPYASYEVVVDGTSGDIGPAGPTLQRLASDGSTVLQSSEGAGLGINQSLRFFNPTGSAVQGELIRVQSASCSLDCGPDDVYRLRTWETTVSIPRFNNSATQVTLLVLQNRGEAPVGGHLYFWSASGVLLHQQDLDLGAWGSLSLNTSTIPELQGQSGSITVAHGGRYGVIAGKAVAVEPATGFSFDSILAVRPR